MNFYLLHYYDWKLNDVFLFNKLGKAATGPYKLTEDSISSPKIMEYFFSEHGWLIHTQYIWEVLQGPFLISFN